MKSVFGVIIMLLISILYSAGVGAQGMAVNNSGASADNSAILDASSTSQGLLMPRMTASQRSAISNPAKGLLVFQTDGSEGIYVNSGSPAAPSWELLSTGSSAGIGQTFSLAFVAQNTSSVYTSPVSGTFTGITAYQALGTPMPVACTFDALFVNVYTNTAGTAENTTITLCKNGVATGLSVTLTVSATAGVLVSASNTASTVSVAPGDIITIAHSHSGVGTNFRYNITTHCH